MYIFNALKWHAQKGIKANTVAPLILYHSIRPLLPTKHELLPDRCRRCRRRTLQLRRRRHSPGLCAAPQRHGRVLRYVTMH